MTSWLRYWKPKEAQNWWSRPQEVIDRSWSKQYVTRKVKVGDILWFMSVVEGTLYLIGRQDVAEVLTADQVSRRYENLMDAPYAFSAKIPIYPSVKASLMGIAPHLRFVGKVDRLNIEEGIDGRYLQNLCELTPESHELVLSVYETARATSPNFACSRQELPSRG
jgi:hypothetical protein